MSLPYLRVLLFCILVKITKKEEILGFFVKTLDNRKHFVYNSHPF